MDIKPYGSTEINWFHMRLHTGTSKPVIGDSPSFILPSTTKNNALRVLLVVVTLLGVALIFVP